MKKRPFVIIGILSTCFVAAYANAASFDCAKASTWIEKTICSNTELSKLDVTMAKQYKAEISSASDYEDSNAHIISTRNEQRDWLKFQRNTCKTKECLIREYKEHVGKRVLNYLKDSNSSELPNKQAFGTFYEDVNIAMYNPDIKAWDAAESTTNSISIHQVTNKPYMAVIEGELIFTNGHTCVIGDEGAVWADNHWAIRGDQYIKNAELRLYPVIHRGKVQLLLRDIDNRYRETSCGMRGYFDGKVFESK